MVQKALFLDLLLADIFFVSYNNKKIPIWLYIFKCSGPYTTSLFFSSKVYSGNNFNPDWYCSKESDPVF